MPQRSPQIEEKAWDVDLEEDVLADLRDEPVDHVDPTQAPAESVFVIDTPPPYPSGTWHIGAVAQYSLIDVIARSKRMSGERVLFPWGLDRNGINIEQVVEEESGKPLQEWDRAEFVDECRDAIQENSESLERTAKRIAMSCNFEDTYRTDDPEYRALTQKGFIQLWKDGAITEDLRPNNYDPELGTTIADAEVFYEERETDLVHVKWTVKESQEEIVIATTRPELICACQAVIVNPDDERYQHLVGKHAELPLYDRTVEIREHPHVDPEFGTGTMMVCSYGDQADVRLFRELDLDPIKAIDQTGEMTEAAGPYAGLAVEDAREKIKEDLTSKDLVAETERVEQQFPISERSDAAVEIVPIEEWYVSQTDVKDEMRRIAEEMDFHPDKHRQLLLDWIDTVSIDWPVSRRRYYHTEIPIWYLEDEDGEADYVVVPPEGPYYKPWQEDPPEDSMVYDRETREKRGRLDAFLEEYDGLTVRGEEKVFDTWMDSSQSNLFITGWHEDEAAGFFKENFPVALRPQGRDIVRTWLYYTALKSHLLEDDQPFENVWITGLGMDEHGRKMSKSLGNVIEPSEVLDEYGADAFRFWIASECTIGDDYRVREEKIEGARKFITKLYNVARFLSMFEPPEEPADPATHDVNAWIRAEFNETRDTCLEGYEEFDPFEPANAIRDFVWNLFAPHYMEMVKSRAYDDDWDTIRTLQSVVKGTIELLAPIAPIVTYQLYRELYGENVHEQSFPDPLETADPGLADLTETVTEFNSDVWSEKKEMGISLGSSIEGVTVPDELAPFEPDLVDMHGLEDA
ncbi:valine--tRNA ligase [Thermoplasmatales archaeon SW_10_69_26]|nr:MAG: valine--tRNA ligase [Thermoplasmatales archaeon SW_10_69_26]